MTKRISHISCVIIVKNAQKTITNTLASLSLFDDVVLYDNGSTDQTIQIAKTFKNVNLIQGEFKGFGWTKNHAAKFAKNNWVLSLDADETISMQLADTLCLLKPDPDNIYIIKRINFYKDFEIKHCWGNDMLMRLYNKNITSFSDSFVHEHLLIKNLHAVTIDGTLKHFPYSDITDFIIKLDIYSTLFAKDKAGKKSSSPAKALFNGVYSFIKTYFFKQGFLDGYAGLVIAFSHMATNFYKYIKLYELNKELKK